jgi:MATE family multidrug resistance protein
LRKAARGFAREVLPTLMLAGPVIFAEIGWVMMGVVDTMIIGRLGAEELGAIGVGGTLFLALAMFGIGMLLGLDSLVSQAAGAGRTDDCHQILAQGLYLAAMVCVPLCLLVFFGAPWLGLAGVQPHIVVQTIPYARAVVWSLVPLLAFTAFRRYLQSTGRVFIFVFVMLTANVINLGTSLLLVFGYPGVIRPLGVLGAGWATTIMYTYMATVVVGYTLWVDRGVIPRFIPRPDPVMLRRLARLGFPAAVQMTLESGIFAVVTMLAGRLDADSLAAHQVVQTVAGLSAMLSIGMATAAAVRVGHAVGRRDPEGAACAGMTSIILGVTFMTASGIVFLAFPRHILEAITPDPEVVAKGMMLLWLAACFQVFDGLQVVVTGALRGLGETRTPMLISMVSHWMVGLPVGYVLAFHRGMGITGLWVGLTVGLFVTGLSLLYVWQAKLRAEVPLPFTADEPCPEPAGAR